MSGLTFCKIHIHIYIYIVASGTDEEVLSLDGYTLLENRRYIYIYIYIYMHVATAINTFPLHRYGKRDPMRTTTRHTVFAVTGT